jgi:hypothetical protein
LHEIRAGIIIFSVGISELKLPLAAAVVLHCKQNMFLKQRQASCLKKIVGSDTSCCAFLLGLISHSSFYEDDQ